MKTTDFSYYTEANGRPKGKTVLIGMMEDGPVGQGFTLPSGKNALYLLGDNEISRSYQFLIASGIPAEDILLYRLNGQPSRLSLANDNEVYFQFVSVGAHERDNDIRLTVSEEGLSLTSFYEHKTTLDAQLHPNFKRTYLFTEYPYLSDLASAVNSDASFGLVDVFCKETRTGATAEHFNVPGEYFFSKGTSDATLCVKESRPSESYLAQYWPYFYNWVLGPGYEGECSTRLMSLPAETFYFTDIQIDNAPKIAEMAARIAAQKTAEQDIVCTAVFRTSLIPETEQDAFADKLNALYSTEERSALHMQHLHAVVGEERASDGSLRAGSLHYLLLSMQSAFSTSLSNKSLLYFSQLNVTLSKSLIANLQANGYICIVPSIRKKFVCAYVQNIAQKTGVLLENFNNQRLVGVISCDVKEILEKYIGGTKNSFQSSTVVKVLQEYLSQYVTSGTIASYEVGLSEDHQVQSRGLIQMRLALYNEVKEVKSNIQVSTEGWEIDLWNLTA